MSGAGTSSVGPNSGLGVGSRLAGRYELRSPIATGGMAQVWRAIDTVLDRPVAVKVLHPHLATDRGFLLRFRREAVAAARLSHRNIVAIYDTVSEPEAEAIVMELVDGRTLRDVLDEVGSLSSKDSVHVGVQIAEALDEAHRGGVVHRDIKPSNILLCSDQRVMVTDFGIAKAGEDTDLTVTGTLLGTAKYLAPEQVTGDPVDPRSDLYALGVVLFETLAGRPPFKADTDAATALARLQADPPRIGQFKPDVPRELDDVVHRAMARRPEARFQRAQDLRVALTAVDLAEGADDRTLIVADDRVETEEHDDYDHYDGWDDEEESFFRSERSWLVPTMAVVLVAGALLVAGFLLSRSPLAGDPVDDQTAGGQSGDDEGSDAIDESDSVGTTVLTNVTELIEPTPSGATALDFTSLGGDGDENSAEAALAIDGDPETVWKTETYRAPQFGRLKPAVGLLIDLGGAARVTGVDLETRSDGWTVEIFVGDEFIEPPEGWGEPAAVIEDGDGDEDVEFSAVGRFMLLWITDHGVSDDGSDDNEDDDHRFELAEVIVH